MVQTRRRKLHPTHLLANQNQNGSHQQKRRNLIQTNQSSNLSTQRSDQEVQHQSASKNTSNEESLNEKLQTLYKDVASAPSYSAKITDFLRQHDVHGVYRKIVKKTFPRRRVIARFPFEIFMGDLLEYPNYKTQNRGFKFILILIDAFTKMLYAVPMKKKDADHSAAAFSSIFQTMDRFPINLVTDGGKEFFNKEVRKILDNHGINHYRCPTYTKTKASIAERVIRTLKSKFERYFYATFIHCSVNKFSNEVVSI